jgi:hypothetical protein
MENSVISLTRPTAGSPHHRCRQKRTIAKGTDHLDNVAATSTSSSRTSSRLEYLTECTDQQNSDAFQNAPCLPQHFDHAEGYPAAGCQAMQGTLAGSLA